VPFTIAPLLLHSDAVPQAAREALKAGLYGPPAQREAELQSAARLLYAEADIPCEDARELVGLEPGGCCG
jgi:hypothetical protein